MFQKIVRSASAVMIGAVIASAAPAAVLINGGFEAPMVPGANPCCLSYSPGNPLTGWSVPAGDVEIVRGTVFSTNGNLAYEGAQYLDLVGVSGAGSIAQSFATAIGQTYSISFAYSHNIFGSPPLASATAAFGVGSLAGTVTHNTGSTSNLDWKTYSGTFTALSALSTLNFTSTIASQGGGIFLDAIEVEAMDVPEPASWAMMMVGFGAVGAALRRRRARSAVEAF